MNAKPQIIVAMTPDRVIGNKKRLPWPHLSSDVRRFRKITMGHALIMGWSTFIGIVEALGGPLEGRSSIVLTRHHAKEVGMQNSIPVSSPEAALAEAHKLDDEEPFVIGGGAVYERMLPLCRTLHLTQVQAELKGDTWFPAINWREWGEPLEALPLKKHDPVDPYCTSYAVFRR